MRAEDNEPALRHFEENVRPLLVDRCYKCHSGEKPKGGLRLDSAKGVRQGGESGPAVAANRPDDSLLIQAVRHENERKMPPPPEGKLTPAQIDALVSWVKTGAVWTVAIASDPEGTTSPRAPNDEELAKYLQLWLRADTGQFREDKPVFLWPDSSGHARDLAATEGARHGGIGKPAAFVVRSTIYGHPSIRFAAETGLASSPDRLVEMKGDADFTMFAVVNLRRNTASGIDTLIGFGDPASSQPAKQPHAAAIGIGHAAEEQLGLIGGWSNDAGLGRGSFERYYDRPLILTVVKKPGAFASTVRFFVDGEALPDKVNGVSEPLDLRHRGDMGIFMGRAVEWLGGVTGDIAEVAIFNRALDDGQRAGLETHFSTKFNVPLAAPEIVSEEVPPASQHWAFQPVKSVEPPPGDPNWSDHPIDRFIAAKWQEQGLKPVPAAEMCTLLRRVYFDLIGLPPTPDEVAAFLADESPDAFDKVVQRLLDSPHYGERWGRYWLDVARYADTAGDNADYPVPEARLYRDYVIDSFNRDKPYDQFLREQIAGDILAREGPGERYAEQITATTFLGLSRRYATAPYELWHLTLEDTIDTLGQSMLGLTLRCARCHDHKYDPISTRDYYALYGIFESTQYPWAGGEEFASKSFPRQHFAPLLPPEEAKAKLAAHEARLSDLLRQVAQEEKEGPLAKKVAELNQRLGELTKRIEEQKQANQDVTSLTGELAAATKERDEANKQLQDKLGALRAEHRALHRAGLPPDLPGAYGVQEGPARSAAIQMRGEPERKGRIVPRGAIACLTGGHPLKIEGNESGRKQLAQWLTQPDHPLTARVMVNRLWQHHFGQGLVATPSNFGARGSPPTHPELLDYLAGQFVKSGWSNKAMHRLILSSKTWQLASTGNEANAAIDPSNQLYWRHDRRRLDAEAIRDAILFASGRLNLARPGEHPFPRIKDWGFTQHNQFKAVYPSTHRSVYLMTQRLQRHPFLALFDGPDPNTTTEKRTAATVPLQSLYLMNSAEIRAEAEAFAKRILTAAPDDDARIKLAHELAYARPANSAELAKGVEYLSKYREIQRGAGNNSTDLAVEAWTSYARVLLTANEFFYVD